MEENNTIKKPKNYNPEKLIDDLKKLKPNDEKSSELLNKLENIISSQYKTIKRLSDIVMDGDSKGIEDISKTISESYEEFKQQLQIARYVQKAIFPKFLPDNDIVSIMAKLFPMEETSSDFYDFYEILKGRVYGILVVDVSGHGVSAALVTSMVKMLFGSAVSKYLSPKLVLNHVNKELSKTLDQSSYLSCFYCIIDLYDKDLVYVNAGHTGNKLYSLKEKKFRYLQSDDPMVGVDDKYEYEEIKLKLDYGDKLLIHTDGLSKLKDSDNNQYTDEILLNILNDNDSKDTQTIFDMLKGSIEKYIAETKQKDDITLFFVDIDRDAGSKIKKGSFREEESKKLLEYYKKLLKIKEQNSDKEGIIDVLTNISDLYNAMGNYRKSVTYLNDALGLAGGVDDSEVEINIVDKLAELYLKTGNLKKAINYINKNLKYYRNSKDEKKTMKAYSLLSQVYYMQRKPDLAKKYQQSVIQIANKFGDKRELAVAYNRLGVYYHSDNDYDKSMECYNKGKEIIDTVEESPKKAYLVNNIGNIHRSTGNLKEAEEHFKNALDILKGWEDEMTKVIILHNLGELYIRLKKFEDALKYLSDSLELSYKNAIPSVETNALIHRAELYQKLGNYDECVKDCSRAIEIINETKVDHLRGKLYTIIGLCFEKMSDDEMSKNKEEINKILSCCKVDLAPEKFFKKAISRSRNPMFAETNVPALYEYASYLLRNDPDKAKAKQMLKEAYQLAVKFRLILEKENIQEIAEEYEIELS